MFSLYERLLHFWLSYWVICSWALVFFGLLPEGVTATKHLVALVLLARIPISVLVPVRDTRHLARTTVFSVKHGHDGLRKPRWVFHSFLADFLRLVALLRFSQMVERTLCIG